MSKKCKNEYQKKEIIKRRFNELGFRYLQVWFCIFVVYLYLSEYLEVLSDIVINNKPLPIVELLIYSFIVAWIIPFTVVFYKGVNLSKIRKSLIVRINKQDNEINYYIDQFKDGRPQTMSYQKKVDRMENKLTKFKTQLVMLGFDEE